jgi:C-terminal processing protease CtpA/Prc
MPNSHFREQFDYSYTGLGMYYVDGVVKILDIMKDSPAERAGLREDDVIMAVQNNFGQNIQAYKNLMQTPGEKVRILVSRNGEPVLVTLKVLNLMR